jgi:hypothetical protein
LQLLHDIALVVRFGATLLSITTLLTLIGLFVGPRRSRVAGLLFGGGGLSLLLIPVLLSTYAGRYTVPMAAPMVAAAGVVLHELVTAVNRRWQLSAAAGAGAASAGGAGVASPAGGVR